ncbi:V-set domain containing T-cell activation inhibitor 1-like [Channa argus]|uniref:V-set domain containing T-cell activation inhibitor 1-like n=1 Tax=Channa argus TaxID=215402 RepID=UPI00352168AC
MFASKWTIFICLLLNCSASEVKPGDKTTLQCQGPTDADIDTVLLKWIRPDLKSDGYVFYFKDNQIQKDLQHPSFHGRVELRDPQMKDGDFSVILKNITINDTGIYECRVRYGGSELISNITLTVTDSGLDERGGDKDGHVGLIVGLSVGLSVVVLVSFIIYRKYRIPRV